MSEIRKRKSDSTEETEKLQPETESDHVSFVIYSFLLRYCLHVITAVMHS